MLKTVREVALEAQIERLQRKLTYAEARERDFLRRSHAFLGEPVSVLDVPPDDSMTLRLIARWAINCNGAGAHAVGRTFAPDNSGFSYSYYVQNPGLYASDDHLNVLGALHERVIKELAARYQGAPTPPSDRS